MKTLKAASLLQKVIVFAKWMIFDVFHQMSRFLQLLAGKFVKRPKHASLPKKVLILVKWINIHAFSRNGRPFGTFGRKVDENAEMFLFPGKVASFGHVDDFSCFFTK